MCVRIYLMSEFSRLYPSFLILYISGGSIRETCIGVLGIHNICHFTSRDIVYTIHFTSRDMEYCVQYFGYFQEYWVFRKIKYGPICQFIRDTCLFTSRDMGYLETLYPEPYTSLIRVNIFLSFTFEQILQKWLRCILMTLQPLNRTQGRLVKVFVDPSRYYARFMPLQGDNENLRIDCKTIRLFQYILKMLKYYREGWDWSVYPHNLAEHPPLAHK